MAIQHPAIPLTTDTASIHGLRAIFNICVVLYHTLLILPLALDDPKDINKLVSGSVPAIIVSVIATLGHASVDIFLLISGFFLNKFFSYSQRIAPSAALRYIVFRYLRLAPAYLCISFALRSLGKAQCINPPEFFLVHLRNLADLCIFFGWSIHVDFVSHVLLLPFLHSPLILALIIIITPFTRLWTWYHRGGLLYPMPPTVFSFSTSDEQFSYFADAFAIPRGNFSASDPALVASRTAWFANGPLDFWLIYKLAAVVVGILLYSFMREKNYVYRLVRRFPTASAFYAGSLFAFFHAMEYDLLPQHWARIIHYSAGRILITLATSIIIMLTCTIDDYPSQHWMSRFIRTVLSCQLFSFLHKFSYVVCLLHLGTAFVVGKVPPTVTKERVAPGWVLVMGIKWYVLTIATGLPIWGIEWVALKGRRWILTKLSVREKSENHLRDKKSA